MVFIGYKTHNSVDRYYWLVRRKYWYFSLWILFLIDKLIFPDYRNSLLLLEIFHLKNILNLVSEYILPLSVMCLFASSRKNNGCLAKYSMPFVKRKQVSRLSFWRFIHRLKRHSEMCEAKNRYFYCDLKDRLVTTLSEIFRFLCKVFDSFWFVVYC